jgi:hypothetical protein
MRELNMWIYQPYMMTPNQFTRRPTCQERRLFIGEAKVPREAEVVMPEGANMAEEKAKYIHSVKQTFILGGMV